jgi:hypothetical protein
MREMNMDEKMFGARNELESCREENIIG